MCIRPLSRSRSSVTLKDCSRRGDIVLDPFGGSGTTLIAAQKTGRLARLIEFDPAYCDVIIRRFENVTGKSAVLERTRQTFEDVSAETSASAGAKQNRQLSSASMSLGEELQ
jgi:hypothetical protein